MNHNYQRRIALIDGDILVYRTGFAGQQTIYIATDGDGNELGEYKNKTEMEEALGPQINESGEAGYEVEKVLKLDSIANVFHSLDLQLNSIVERSGCTEYRVFLSGPGNFRNQVAVTKPYKGNRKQEKPVFYQDLRERLLGKYKAELSDGIEADDCISLGLEGYGTNAVACSIDKDLRQCTGWHFDWTKEESPVFVDEDTALFNLYRQVITGDATDNIPGIPGIGPKKAEKILLDRGDLSLLDAAKKAYKDAGFDEDYFWEQFDLVYLIRHPVDLQYVEARRATQD